MVLGIGVDILEIDRMRDLIVRRPKITNRLFSESEQKYARQQQDPSQRFAVRFAAKEAVMKVLGTGFGGIDWKDVEVIRDESDAPKVHLSGRAAKRANTQGITNWHLSLSHSEISAVAFVVAS